MALDEIGRQARNKIEKHDHQTRDAATRLAEQLTGAELEALAVEPDVAGFRRLLAAAQLRLAEAAAAESRAQLAAPPPTVAAEAPTDAPPAIDAEDADEPPDGTDVE
jgi:hypothetical protein